MAPETLRKQRKLSMGRYEHALWFHDCETSAREKLQHLQEAPKRKASVWLIRARDGVLARKAEPGRSARP